MHNFTILRIKTVVISGLLFCLYAIVAMQIIFLRSIFWMALLPFLFDMISNRARNDKVKQVLCLILGVFTGFLIFSFAPFFADTLGDVFGIIVLVILAASIATTVLLIAQLDTLRIFLRLNEKPAITRKQTTNKRARTSSKAARKYNFLGSSIVKNAKIFQRKIRRSYKFLLFGLRQSRKKPRLTKIGLELIWWVYVILGAAFYFLALDNNPLLTLIATTLVLLAGLGLAVVAQAITLIWQNAS